MTSTTLAWLHLHQARVSFAETTVRVEAQPFGVAWGKNLDEAVQRAITQWEAKCAERERLRADPEYPEYRRLLEKFGGMT